MALDRLSKLQHDKLFRISQQGMSQAAAMLSRLLRQTVEVEVADSWLPTDILTAEQQSEPLLGVSMQVSGDIDGALLLTLSDACATWLCDQLLGSSSGNDLLTEPASSTLKEVGNILASSFLASLDDQLGLRALPSPPQLKCAPLARLLENCPTDCHDACLIVRTRLLGTGDALESLQGAIYLFPAASVLEKLLERIDRA